MIASVTRHRAHIASVTRTHRISHANTSHQSREHIASVTRTQRISHTNTSHQSREHIASVTRTHRISHTNTSHQSREHIASVTRTHRISHTNTSHQSRDIATPSQPHRNPIATPSSITPFQHALMHSFIILSFFKHLKREKLNHNSTPYILSLFIENKSCYEQPLML
jgi:hypothetical protein